jgi:hypothetical protein
LNIAGAILTNVLHIAAYLPIHLLAAFIAWRNRFRLMESLSVRVIDMHVAAVSAKQVKLGTHRVALRIWIPENDS